MHPKIFFASTIILFCSFSCFAQIRLPAIIADTVQLQQKSTIVLWGRANPDERVTIEGKSAGDISYANNWLFANVRITGADGKKLNVSNSNKLQMRGN